ncbi:MAG: hypothetical protein CMK82_11080 [Pseudomonadales bacterium]|uniref:hypothetical protein n=1 Tax=Sphingobium sp. TaxID=1912891 RepID=UPI000C642049|nr:hypothetical protein [Sphingobium sp.]MAS67322.1 hypothetical protein [Pseudomonadales bacterium]MBS90820.1 hypothetical protein [Sphingobium sp.]
MSTYIVGDEIHFRGYRVAILTADAPPTVLGDFEDGVNNDTLFEEPKLGIDKNLTPDEFKDQVTHEAIQETYDAAKRIARGGLLSLKDLARVLKEQGTDVK